MKKIYLPLLTLLSFSCGRFENQETRGKHEGRKIICIAKQYTEIIYALGAEKELIAVDVSSTFPENAKKLPTVGYHRALSLEALLAMKPDLIIHDNNIGPDHVVAQLGKLKIPMKVFGHYQSTIAGTDSLIREMGTWFGREKQADSICKKLDGDMAGIMAEQQNFSGMKPKVCVIHYGQASNVFLTMTKKSNAAKMISWAGGSLDLDGEKGMMPLSAEVIAKSDPDVILLTDFGYDKLGSLEKIKELPGVSGCRAAKNNRIYRIEEHDLVYLGPRTGTNVELIKKLIQPGNTQKQ